MKVPEIQTLDDFACYLLTYVAEADLRVSNAEKDFILQHVSPEKYERIKRFIDNRSDYENLQLIDYYRGEFLTNEADRKQLLNELAQIGKADDKAGPMELYMIRAIGKLLTD